MTLYRENKVIAHKPENLYALVCDVKAYPEFLPWCLAARVREQSDKHMVADLAIGFRIYREKFTSHVEFDPKRLEIKVEYSNGPFKHLRNTWAFTPYEQAPHEQAPYEQGCGVDFFVDFEFKSQIFQSVIEAFFHEAVKRMVNAFEVRADVLYPRIDADPASGKSIK